MMALAMTRLWEAVQALAQRCRAADAAIDLYAEQQAAKWRARIRGRS